MPTADTPRRRHDPFAPHTPPAVSVEAEPVEPPVGGDGAPVELERMRKAELVELAQARGVDPDGTRAELINRLGV